MEKKMPLVSFRERGFGESRRRLIPGGYPCGYDVPCGNDIHYVDDVPCGDDILYVDDVLRKGRLG
jgi:hypothetical protein